MRQILGLGLTTAAVAVAILLIFQTQAGAHIGAMLGLGMFSLSRIEFTVLQLAGFRTIDMVSIVHADCIVLAAISAWNIVVGLRDFSDLPFKTILNAALALVGASSIWVLGQVS